MRKLLALALIVGLALAGGVAFVSVGRTWTPAHASCSGANC